MNDHLPQLPSASYVERLVTHMEKHPRGALLFILFAAVAVCGLWVFKH
jgi:hypothetical protein